MITKFKSQGIRDESTHDTVLVNDLGLHVDNMTVNETLSPVAVKGDLNISWLSKLFCQYSFLDHS